MSTSPFIETSKSPAPASVSGAGQELLAGSAEPSAQVELQPAVRPSLFSPGLFGPFQKETLDPGEELIRGVVGHVTYYNETSHYTVLQMQIESTSGSPPPTTRTSVVGTAQSGLEPGVTIVARGEWQQHPKFGRQFRARAMVETEPVGKEGVERYLASGIIRGLGPELAHRIVEVFGDETLEILEHAPERLLTIPGIGEKKLEQVLEAWREKRQSRDTMLFFQQHGVSLSLATRIFNHYGKRAIEVVKRNPYQVAKDMPGVGFITADRLAQSLGLDKESDIRLVAGTVYTLTKASDDGHCFLPKLKLLERASKLLEVDDYDKLGYALSRAELLADVIVDRERIYLPALHQAEGIVAGEISSRLQEVRPPAISISRAIIDDTLRERHAKSGASSDFSGEVIHLSEEQQKAVELAAEQTMLVITGGPGCGKTTVVRALVRMFQRAGLELKLAAPTGRAAQRLAEVCGMSASTLHRMLKFDPFARSFHHNRDNRLPVDAVIVDESSMIDVQLAAALLEAIPPSARLIWVGDADQLPSVGPGTVLSDLLLVNRVPRVQLTRLFRRSNESVITTLAHDINRGRLPDIPAPGTPGAQDTFFIRSDDQTKAAEIVERLVCTELPDRFGIRGSDIAVLTPMNKGELGTISLNRRLQARLIPNDSNTARVKVGDLELMVGDRVCQRVNNYNLDPLGVFNGDQGSVSAIDPTSRTIRVSLWDGREVEYTSDTLSQLDLGYCLTIHRSQGTEVSAVVLVLHDCHRILLERQLLYTAVTRAKKLLILVGTRRALEFAAQTTRSRHRYTGLVDRIIAG